MTLLDTASEKNLIDESKYTQLNQKLTKKFDWLRRHRTKMEKLCNPRARESEKSGSSKLGPLPIISLHVTVIALMRFNVKKLNF